ncbi:unnamed protein product [Diatraea saccharalis]|uniref:Uncharacterized protein n=1 Tax=Diatraea saccharalis TaxID=40085 RepID=A0A9N9WIB4_9NEOP|nr:unnamed protein product [Diatraea saccharalis]
MASLMDDILSPSNAERALKILALAARGVSRGNPMPNIPNFDEVPTPRYSVQPKAKLLAELLQPRRPIPRQVPVEAVQAPREIYQPVVTEQIYPSVPIPQPCAVQPPIVRAVPEVYRAVPEVYTAAPQRLISPFLPAASPVSAIAPPTSSLLPPMDPTQVKAFIPVSSPVSVASSSTQVKPSLCQSAITTLPDRPLPVNVGSPLPTTIAPRPVTPLPAIAPLPSYSELPRPVNLISTSTAITPRPILPPPVIAPRPVVPPPIISEIPLPVNLAAPLFPTISPRPIVPPPAVTPLPFVVPPPIIPEIPLSAPLLPVIAPRPVAPLPVVAPRPVVVPPPIVPEVTVPVGLAAPLPPVFTPPCTVPVAPLPLAVSTEYYEYSKRVKKSYTSPKTEFATSVITVSDQYQQNSYSTTAKDVPNGVKVTYLPEIKSPIYMQPPTPYGNGGVKVSYLEEPLFGPPLMQPPPAIERDTISKPNYIRDMKIPPPFV